MRTRVRREWPSAPRTASLPTDLLEEGARRIRRLQAPAAIAIATCLWGNYWLAVRVGPDSGVGTLAPWGVAGCCALLVTMYALTRRPGVEPAWLIDRALVFRVVMAFFMALFFHALPVDSARVPRGFSPVSIWVLATTLLLPSTLGKTFLSTIASALMDPLGLLVNVATGVESPPPLSLAALFLPTALSAAVALLGARVLYSLSLDVAEARDMGSYRLVALIGRGGMGEVWRGEHRMLARPAAVKLIRTDPSAVLDRDRATRFEREARATATLRSPNTVQLYDFGVADDGSFYYAMELLEGFTLEQLVRRFGPIPPERAVHLLVQACRSLAEAHRAGLVHRDIKPSNLFVCRCGEDADFVKVLDFGLVKAVDGVPAGTTLTSTGVVLGTPATMPPEVARGRKDIDARADLYSLGCVGYTLLTGSHVFENDTPMSTIHDHAATPPEPLSRRARQRIPPELEQVLMECLEKDPSDRPASARDLSRRLAAVPLESPWTVERAESWWDAYSPRADEKTISIASTTR